MFSDVQLDAPLLGELEKEYLCRVVDSGFVSTVGPFVQEFEGRCADYLGVEEAVALQSGTAALHLALYSQGIGPGDEVIVPALSFVATANPVRYVGATPVFADVSPGSWTIDVSSIESLITDRTRAIIPVHLYGVPCEMDRLMNIAADYGLVVIEDATESLGAVSGGLPTGTWGDFGCFSFNGNKTITTGGGGVVVAKESEKLARIRFLANQAKSATMDFLHPEIGFN